MRRPVGRRADTSLGNIGIG